MPYDGPFSRRRLINLINALRGDFDSGEVAAVFRGILLENDTAKSLPNNTDADVFTVSDGRILVFGYWLDVTTVIQSQTTNVKLRWKLSGGSYGDLTAVVDTNAAAVGSSICVTTSTISTAAGLFVGHACSGFASAANGMIFPPGTLGFHSATNSTGAVKGRLLWAPLDEGATVAAV